MTLEHVVVLSGQQTMLHTDVVLVEYHRACHYVENVLSMEIIQVMILICFVLKLVVHVIVEIQVL